jgi:hypothetical protein
MMRIAFFLLLPVLSFAPAIPAKAQIYRGEDAARQAQKAGKKQQKAYNKALKKQLKASRRAAKKQQKAARRAAKAHGSS